MADGHFSKIRFYNGGRFPVGRTPGPASEFGPLDSWIYRCRRAGDMTEAVLEPIPQNLRDATSPDL